MSVINKLQVDGESYDISADGSNISGTVAIKNGGTGATTAAAALTNLGITATATELNYVDGVTSDIQTQLDDKTPMNRVKLTTPATAGWYRIASTKAGIGNATGLFKITSSGSSKYTTAYFTANTSYGRDASTNITVLTCSQFSSISISKIRIVYHTTYSNNYAHIEIYNANDVATTITIDMIDGSRWTLAETCVAGEIPEGYSNKEVTLSSGVMIAPTFKGNLTGNVTGDLTGIASKVKFSESTGSLSAARNVPFSGSDVTNNDIYYNDSFKYTPNTNMLTVNIAGTAPKLEKAKTIDGINFDGSANVTHYGACSTAADTIEKIVSLANFTLVTGARVLVKFTNTNTADSPTLNVNSTGAKAIMYRNSNIESGYLAKNKIYEFIYNGTNWELIGSTQTNASLGQGYAICPTAIATADIAAELDNYTIIEGGIVAVKFAVDVPANATLNINWKGAKNIYYKGSKIKANVIKAEDTATFIYSNNHFNLISIDRNIDNNIAIKKCTQEEYDSMTMHDENTLYIIIEE